jgi:hypothetical protein
MNSINPTENEPQQQEFFTRDDVTLSSGNLNDKEMKQERPIIKAVFYHKESEMFWTEHKPLILKKILNDSKNKLLNTTMETGLKMNRSTRSSPTNSKDGKWIHFKSSQPFINTQKTLGSKHEQARASTELYELLDDIKEKINFENEETAQKFATAMEQAAKLAVYGFGSAKLQDQEAREYATKALRLPARLNTWRSKKWMKEERSMHSNQSLSKVYTKQDLNKELYQEQQAQVIDLSEEISNEEIQEDTQDHLEEIFTAEGEAVKVLFPRQQTVIPQTVSATNMLQIKNNSYSTQTPRRSADTRKSTNQERSATHGTNTKRKCKTKETRITTATATATTATTATTTDSTTYTTRTARKLFDSRGWDITRRSTREILQKLDKNHISPMAFTDSKGRIPITVYKESCTLEQFKTTEGKTRPIGDQSGSGKVYESRNNREVHKLPSIETVPVKILHVTGGNKEETYSGLQKIEQIHSGGTLQDGRSTGFKRANRKGRFYSETRSQRCVHGGTHTQGIKTVFSIRKSRIGIPIQNTKLWFKCGTKSVYKATEVCNRTFEEKRDTFSVLSRRCLSATSRSRRITKNCTNSSATFRTVGVYYESKEECTDSVADPRLSRIHLRYKKDGDKGTRSKDKEIDTTFETSQTSGEEIMSMGSKFDEKDDSNDPGSGRSIITYKIPSKRSGKIANNESTRLGKKFPMVKARNGGDGLVAAVSHDQEWITDQANKDEFSRNNNIYRQFGDGLGGNLTDDQHIWILEGGREEMVDKRKRADSHLFCTEAPCPKVQRQDDQSIHRQHNFNKIYNKIRRYCICNITGDCSKDTGAMQPIQDPGDLPTHTRNNECKSRPVIKNADTTLRTEHSKENVSNDQETMGPSEGGRIREQTQSQTKEVLEPITRPRSDSHRCIPTGVAENRVVLLPSVEINTSGTASSQGEKDKEDGSGNTVVANTILVSNDNANETIEGPNSVQEEEINYLSRMAVIRRARKEQGFSEEERNYLEKTIRESTAKAYDNGWSLWVTWCALKQQDPCAYNVRLVLAFLMEHTHYSPQHLNTIRSAIGSVFRQLHPGKEMIANRAMEKRAIDRTNLTSKTIFFI